MKFSEVVDHAIEFLRQRERVSYRALKREFDLDDEALEDLKAELIDAKRLASDEDGKVMVWTGTDAEGETAKRGKGEAGPQFSASTTTPLLAQDSALRTPHSTRERCQLTVMFCDLVGSIALFAQFDPEDYQAVVQHYHAICDTIIARYDGQVAQHLGDGLLVYFGYPVAHEDDAQRAVRTALDLVEAMQHLSLPMCCGPSPLDSWLSGPSPEEES